MNSLPIDTGRKLNAHKTSERVMYVHEPFNYGWYAANSLLVLDLPFYASIQLLN